MAYLHSDREQFRDAIDLAYEQTGVMVQAKEKDKAGNRGVGRRTWNDD